jgi:hypothetical protein
VFQLVASFSFHACHPGPENVIIKRSSSDFAQVYGPHGNSVKGG